MAWFPILVLVAQLSAAPNPVQHAYGKLTSQQIEAKRTTAKPPKDARKLDVSAKIRSASFGHKTWLIIAAGGKQFWVEYGRSTNTKAGLFGPFSVEEPSAPAKPIDSPSPPQDPKYK